MEFKKQNSVIGEEKKKYKIKPEREKNHKRLLIIEKKLRVSGGEGTEG